MLIVYAKLQFTVVSLIHRRTTSHLSYQPQTYASADVDLEVVGLARAVGFVNVLLGGVL